MSYQFFAKKGPTLAFAAVVVCFIISVFPLFGGLSAFSKLPTAQQATSEEGNIFGLGMYLSVIMLVIAVIVALALSLIQVITNPKESKKALVALGILAVIFVIFYFMADAVGTGSLAATIEKFSISEFISRVISAGLQLTIVGLIASVVITIFLEIWNYFKNA